MGTAGARGTQPRELDARVALSCRVHQPLSAEPLCQWEMKVVMGREVTV